MFHVRFLVKISFVVPARSQDLRELESAESESGIRPWFALFVCTREREENTDSKRAQKLIFHTAVLH